LRVGEEAAARQVLIHHTRRLERLAWRHLEGGVDAAWAAMKSALEKASAKFKK
jgi:hypothetical protein